jgi:hypothetical protein
MNDSIRSRRVWGAFVALLVVAVVAIALIILSRSEAQQKAALVKQQAADAKLRTAVEGIRRHGGFVLFKPSNPSSVVSVDLSGAKMDAELMQTLGKFTEIERLTLDSAKFQSEDWALLDKLTRLHSLSLTNANITDADVTRLPLQLTSLSLNKTSITDQSMAHVAKMNGLASLDIVDTGVTSAGLQLLEPLRNLKKLRIGESCVTAESAQSLRLMQPQSVDIVVSSGLGRTLHECLSVCDRPNIRGHHPDGYILWEADSAWSNTLAGVVEAVVSEIGLDPEQASRLLEILSEHWGGWEPIRVEPPQPITAFSYSTSLADKGQELASVDEFVRGFQQRSTGLMKADEKSNWDYWSMRRFAREKFTATDVPRLLAAIRGAQYSPGDSLFLFGPFLLVHHGIENREVRAELDRMLTHQVTFVRLNTVCAFGYGGARPFYSPEEWVPNQAADEFAFSRLLPMCKKPGEMQRIAWSVLAEIAHRRPEYVADVLAVIVDVLEGDSSAPYELGRHLSRLGKLNPDAALAVVPRLRAMLNERDLQQLPPGGVLQAISATACVSPPLAQEIAIEYLGRARDGKPRGPLAPLLSQDTPEANRRVVIALIDTESAREELALAAKMIRDWRMAKSLTNE